MLVRPKSARECLIHHRDLWSRVVVEFREQAATEQRQPEQVKVLGRNSGPLDKSRLLLIDVVPFKRQVDVSLKDIQFVLVVSSGIAAGSPSATSSTPGRVAQRRISSRTNGVSCEAVAYLSTLGSLG